MNCRLLVSACLATLVTLAMTIPAQAQARKPGDGKGREELIKKFDKDGDGKLSDSERQAARGSLPGGKPGAPGAGRPAGGKPGAGGDREAMMIKRFDKDGDGKLSDSEKQAMTEALKARGGAGGKPGARPADGKPGAGGDRMAEMIKRFDKDGDGKLSDAEKKAAMEARGGGNRPAGKRPEKK